MFNKNTVHNRVMEVVSRRIKEAQKAHDEEAKILQQNAETQIEEIEHNLEADIAGSLDKHVNNVFLIK